MFNRFLELFKPRRQLMDETPIPVELSNDEWLDQFKRKYPEVIIQKTPDENIKERQSDVKNTVKLGK